VGVTFALLDPDPTKINADPDLKHGFFTPMNNFQATGEASRTPAIQREHSALQNMEFLLSFLFQGPFSHTCPGSDYETLLLMLFEF
jgi:hypothetical protein